VIAAPSLRTELSHLDHPFLVGSLLLGVFIILATSFRARPLPRRLPLTRVQYPFTLLLTPPNYFSLFLACRREFFSSPRVPPRLYALPELLLRPNFLLKVTRLIAFRNPLFSFLGSSNPRLPPSAKGDAFSPLWENTSGQLTALPFLRPSPLSQRRPNFFFKMNGVDVSLHMRDMYFKCSCN